MISTRKYLAIVVVMLACCFMAQMYALHLCGGRPGKCESNYFSSLGRIQAASVGKPEVLFLGSSITGRLQDRSQGYGDAANMGCDGGSAVDALRAIDHGILPSAPWIVIEANTLHLALTKKTSEISKTMQTKWFQVGMHVPCLASYARPSAFFYSKLLSKRIGSSADLSKTEGLSVTSKPAKVEQMTDGEILPEQRILGSEITTLIKRIESKGSRVMIVWLPPGRKTAAAPAWILDVAKQSDCYWWDLGQDAPANEIELTDGVHMAVPSASRTSVSLIEAVTNL